MKTHRTPGIVCPLCHHRLTQSTNVEDDSAPQPQDITICIRCSGILLFDGALKLRAPTTEELQEIMDSRSGPTIAELLRRISAHRPGQA